MVGLHSFNIICVPLDHFYILGELASQGNLLAYLRKKRHNGEILSWQTKIDYGLQISKGMAHLANKKVNHLG